MDAYIRNRMGYTALRVLLVCLIGIAKLSWAMIRVVGMMAAGVVLLMGGVMAVSRPRVPSAYPRI